MATSSPEAGSLASGIAWRLTIGTAIVLFVFGWWVDRRIEGRLHLEFDERLLTKARALATLTSYRSDGEYELDFADEVMPEFERVEDPDYFQVWVESSRVLERSHSLGENALERWPEAAGTPRYRDVVLPDARPGRSVQLDYPAQVEADEGRPEGVASHSSAGGPTDAARAATVVVASGLPPLRRALFELRATALLGGLVLLAVLLVIARWAVVSGLAPLRVLSLEVARLTPDRLDRPITAATPREVAPLVDRLNALLQRTATVLERERRVSADVAHELRTPVAELRSLSEIGARWPGDETASREFFTDAQRIAQRMERTISVLLALARAEARAEPAQQRELEARLVVDDARDRWLSAARERGLELRVDAPGALRIRTDPDRLSVILDNLLDNAISHTCPPGVVEVTIRAHADGVALTITNPSSGLTASDLTHLTERFWMKDAARTQGHSGLGLSLAMELARSLDSALTFTLEGAPGRERFVARLRLPNHFAAS